MTSTDLFASSWQRWPAAAKLKLRQALWAELCRPAQQAPEGTGWTWYLRGGRGSGKTRAASEALASLIREAVERDDPSEAGDWAVVAPTFGDGRDTCVEGPSGLRLTLAGYTKGPWQKAWSRSYGQLLIANGSTLFIDGANDGAERIQGKNLRAVWCDEIGLWTHWQKAWDESILFAVRKDPGVKIVDGTPKAGHGLVKRLMYGDPKSKIPPAEYQSHMKTSDNIDNLSPIMVEQLLSRYGGTTLGRQELEGELLTEVEGALWTQRLIDTYRLSAAGPMIRVVVGVDPAGSESTETGIVSAGLARGVCACGVHDQVPHVYVLADDSLGGSPDQWGTAAVMAFDDAKADRIVGERNYGGDMVGHVIKTVRPGVAFGYVTAARGKDVRAEPVVALYEQGRVHHVGTFGDLESELTTWRPKVDSWSPNRLDALVWAVTELTQRPSGRASWAQDTGRLPDRIG